MKWGAVACLCHSSCLASSAVKEAHLPVLSREQLSLLPPPPPPDLDPLPRCVEPNPIDPAFSPMRLYRRLDVRRVAITRWGSWEAVQAEYWRRRKR